MSGQYYNNLIKKVLEASYSDVWDVAVKEWVIFDCEEDESLMSACVCGKENLRYLFTIKNMITGNDLFPIGSSCIKKFGREDLKEKANIQESMFKLLHAVKDNKFISLNPELFSRKLLLALYEEGAFTPNQYNNFNGENDYDFLLKMFNKRNKESITPAQHKKIRAIIVSSIKPYLQTKLDDKIHRI